MKDRRIFDVSCVKEDEFVFKSVAGKVYSNGVSYVEKRIFIEKRSIIGVGKSFVVLKQGVRVENPYVGDWKSFNVSKNFCEHFKFLNDDIVDFVEKVFIDVEQDGNSFSKDIIVEKQEPNNDVSLKPNFIVVMGSISFSSKPFVTPPLPYPQRLFKKKLKDTLSIFWIL